MSFSFVAKKAMGSVLLALLVALFVPALASADAPDVQTATGTIAPGPNPGDRTVTVRGTWAWTTHHSDCNTNRAGVGVAIDWNDPTQLGNPVTTLNGDPIAVGTPTDNVVHPAIPGNDVASPADYQAWKGGCGDFNGIYNTGTFGVGAYVDPNNPNGPRVQGLRHTYPASYTGPIHICALTYDVHGKASFTAPNGSKEITAGGSNRNQDNGAEKNASTPGGNQCFDIHLNAHPSVTTDAGADVTVGHSLADTATLSGGENPTGSITFKLYGPNDADCTGSPIFTSTKTVNGNDQYTSASYTGTSTTGPGTYKWIANYGGDSNNDATANACHEANEDVVVGPGHPTVTTNAGPAVDLGDAIHDSATLAGGSNPTGSITFRLFNNSTCSGTPLFTSTVSVHGNGPYASDEFVPKTAGTYRWIANYGGDVNNSATTNACNAANENVAVIGHPRIQVDKRGAVSSALAGSNVEFILDVTNPGDQPLHNVTFTDSRCNVSAPALDTKHGDASTSTLDPGDLWTYRCTGSTAVGDTNIHNEVETCALPPTGSAVCDTDTADVPLRNPDISIVKAPKTQTVTAGNPINWTLDVKNTGDQRFADAKVDLTDAMCDATPTLKSKNGDASPDFLNPGETWTYTCSHSTKSTDTGTVHNVASVTGTDEAGDQVSDSDTADATLSPPGCTVNCSPPCTANCTSTPHPAIAINKTGPATANAGDTIPYLLDVSNPGDQPFAEPNLSLSDALCGATPTLSSKNGDQTPTKLNPGETWTYTCSVPTVAGQTNVHNVGSVCGIPDQGSTVCAEDFADTVLANQGVLPLLPGVSRLRGPTGCISSRTHVLTVTGSRIARVSFYVDGRYIGTRTKANRGKAFTLTVRGAKLRRGSHRVTARVTYQSGTNPRTKTLTLAFARCARAVTPKFTG
jgi:hypothetical protein